MKRRILTSRQIWAWPAALALATVVALVLALFEDDGALDLICAAVLTLLVWLCLWHGCLARWLGARKS